MKLVEITWVDFFEMDGWTTKKELETSVLQRTDDGVICKTVGYLVTEKEKVLVICQTYQPEEEEIEYSNFAIIPKAMIKGEMLVLKDE